MSDTPTSIALSKIVIKWSFWAWFLYRLGEDILYLFLSRMGISHTPRWQYDFSMKYADNMARLEQWRKAPLLITGSSAPSHPS